MKAWARMFLALAAAALALLGAWHFRRAPDPLFQGRYASQWCQDLLSPDYKERNAAEAALLALGTNAVPQLRVMLRRRPAFWEPLLARAAEHFSFIHLPERDPVLSRKCAAQTLAGLGPAGAAAIPDLIEALDHGIVAREAERALLRMGRPAQTALCNALTDHRDPSIRERAARLLREIGPPSPGTESALAAAARDEAAGVRREAAFSLAHLPELPAEAGRALLSLFRDEHPEVRAAAAEASGLRARIPGSILARLENGLSDAAPIMRLESAKALWRLRARPGEVLPVLIGILETDHAWEAAYALADLGPAAAPAIPALIALLQRERVPRPFRTPPSSAFALGRIGLPAAAPLAGLLGSPEPHVRLAAVMALGFIGKPAAPEAPALLPLLRDPDAEIRHAAALALATIGVETEPVLNALAAALSAEDIHMRFAAADLLRKIEPDGLWSVSPE